MKPHTRRRLIRALVLWALTGALPLAGSSGILQRPPAGSGGVASFEAVGSFHAISVHDLEVMIAWYEGLGFELDSKGENEFRKGALLSRGGVLLELAEFSGARSLGEAGLDVERHEIHGVFKLGFRVRDLDRLFALSQRETLAIFFPIVQATGPLRTFALKDPEGNIVQFFGE